MKRFRIFLSPIMFFGHAAKRAAAAYPLVVSAVTVVVVAVGASGGVALANAGASSPTSSPSWPQLHYGPDRTGYQPDETQIGTGNVGQLAQARTYRASPDPSAPLIANGILYVDTGTLYAFDATGATNCSATPVACTPLWTAPTAYFDGMAIANGDVYVTDAEGVQAFDAAGSTNCSGTPKVCAPLWATSTHSSTGPAFTPGQGSPAVANGRLYVPGYGDGLPLSTGGAYVAAFDAAGSTGCSGSPVVCVPMWTTTGLPASTGNTGSPAIGANGVLYIANQTLYAFDAAGSASCSGTPKVCAPLWTAATTNYPTYSAPAVANGTVYVGSWGSKLYAFDAAGSTNCSTTATGKTCTPLWTAATPTSIGGTPAVANGVVYTVSGDGTLSAFDAAGSTNCTGTVTAKTCTPLWSSAPGPSGYVTSSSPAVANGVVYFSSTDGGTYGYDAAGSLKCSVSGTAKTCSPLWGAVTGFIGGGSPAIVNGVLYINVSGSGTIYAYSLPAVVGSLSVNAGPDQKVIGTNIVDLAGQVTGTPTSTVWSEESGPGTADFASPGSAQTTVTVSAPGTYTFELAASDGAGNSASGQVTVSVLAYVALGDSYSAGDGAVANPSKATGSDYLPGGSSLFPSSSGDASCLQSVHAYPELVDTHVSAPNPVPAGTANPAFSFDACTAAVITDITSDPQRAGKQLVLPQISALEVEPAASVGLVTLTIGGNDAGFGDVMAYCARRTTLEQSCEAHSKAEVAEAINGGAGMLPLEARLQALYTKIKDVTNIDGQSPLASGARIVVPGYPKFFPAGQASACSTGYLSRDFQPSDMAWIDNVIHQVDNAIRTAAAAAGVTYADTYNAFDGHELCQASPYLNDLTLTSVGVKLGIQSFHPTITGQAAFATLAEG